MKPVFYASLFGAVLICGSLAWQGYFTPKKIVYTAPSTATSSEVVSATPQEEKVSILFVGDVMLDRGIKKIVTNTFGGNFASMFEFVKNEIFVPDISVLNLEGPVSDKGGDTGKAYSFRMATSTFPVLKEVGFDIASFANNHVGDWGRDAFDDTLRLAQENSVPLMGAGFSYASATEPVIIEKNGLKIGFLAFSDVGPVHMKAGTSTSGILLLSDPNLEQIIKSAKEKVGQLVVSVHWGEEYKKEGTERQREFAYKLVDWGAVLVIGHHPHVIEPLEEYNGGLIAYSLGNFIFDQYFSKETMEGGVLQVILNKNGIKKYELKKVELGKDFRPAFVENTAL